MLILSFDVGIKNLAFCLINYCEKTKVNKIEEWNIINLNFYEHIDSNINYIIENYKTCKIDELKRMLKSLNLDSTQKKKDLIITLEKYLISNKIIKKKPSIQDISLILVDKLDKLDYIKNIDLVLIENQPSLKNPTMKSIQMILYTYFLIRGMVDKKNIIDIKLISATNKLKKCNQIEQFKNRNKNYSDRKKLSIEYCYYLLDKHEEIDKKILFEKNNKKDDLADAYLQGIYYIEFILF